MTNITKNFTALLLLMVSLGGVLFLMQWANIWVFWILLGSLGILIFWQQKQYRRNILLVSVLGLLTGWRGVDFSPSFIIYPTELFIWLGFILCVLDQIIRRETDKNSNFTLFPVLLLLLALLAVITAFFNGRELLGILFPFKSFIVFIPMLVLFRKWIQSSDQVLFLARGLTHVGIIISGLGLVEELFPQVTALLPAVIQPGVTRYNFEFGSSIQIASFSLWGTPVVSTLLVLIAGITAFLPPPANRFQNIILFFALPVMSFGIIASGYRSAWLGLLVVLLMLPVLKGKRSLPVLILCLLGTVIIFSSAYVDRFWTIFFVTHSQDPTVIQRAASLQNGLHLIQSNWLFGGGWNSPTSFNDWVNVGVWMGLPGLLVFAAWYGRLLIRLVKPFRMLSKQEKSLHFAFLVSLLAYGVSMVSGAMSQVFPIMTAFWFVFCLGWRVVEITYQEEGIYAQAIGSAPHV